jgi:hypothetical protein
MMNALIDTRQFDVAPLLTKVSQEAEREHQKLQEVFSMLGWEDIPDALKIEIKDDVSAMADELEGHYSTCDPAVTKRRQRVAYWVDTFRYGMCSLQTAIEALRGTRL